MPLVLKKFYSFMLYIVTKGVKSNLPSGFTLSMGQGDTGQLGQGDEVYERKKPGFVSGLENIDIIQIVAGGMHSLAVSSNGIVSYSLFSPINISS